MERRIYLDFNASTPLAPEVVEAMQPFLTEHYGNPSSQHWAGAPARAAVERARTQVATLLGCHADEFVFTSGGTESGGWIGMPATRALRDRFERDLKTAFGDHLSVNGAGTERLPNTANVNFIGQVGAEHGGRAHWERAYSKKADDQMSWYQPSPRVSLDLIARTDVDRDARIIDVGGGASRLVDGFQTFQFSRFVRV
jgi:hypothetical protein